MQGLSMNNWPTYIVQEMPEKANSSLPDLIEKIKFGRVEPLTSGLIIDKEDLKERQETSGTAHRAVLLLELRQLLLILLLVVTVLTLEFRLLT